MQEMLDRLGTEQVNPNSLHMDTANADEFLTMLSRANFEAAQAVRAAQPMLEKALDLVREKMLSGGRLIYCGAGTSGRLGVLDASECPPTFGVPSGLVVGVMAGGDRALRFSSESTEDHEEIGVQDMQNIALDEKDVLVAIAASGRTPYCIGALRYARSVGAAAIALSCNQNAKMSAEADVAVELDTGAEVLTGSTRMKAGTATKMALNALSTGAMVALGKVYQNLMVDMKATNEKLRDRAVRMLMTATETSDPVHAAELLRQADGSVKLALVMEKTRSTKEEAKALLEKAHGIAAKAIAYQNETQCDKHSVNGTVR